MTEYRSAGEREAQAVGGDRGGELAHGLGALGPGVLAVVGLVDDERARPAAGEGFAVGGEDLVIEDGDLAGGGDRGPALDHYGGAVGEPRASST